MNSNKKFLKYYDTISKIKLNTEKPVFNTGGKLIIALFEWRIMKEIQWVLNAVLKVYDSQEIGLAIVHGDVNKKYINENFGHWKNILLINTGDKSHNLSSYSKRLTTPELWDYFRNWSHVLVYQCDALLLRKIPANYFKYDYIGAPWIESKMAGNGGFSLRKVESMIKACEKNRGKKLDEIFNCKYEDKFFCNQKNFQYPKSNKEERLQHINFSVEKIYTENPVGLHKFYYWINDMDKFNEMIENIERKLIN